MTSGLVFYAFVVGFVLILGAHALTETSYPVVTGNTRPSERPSRAALFNRVFSAAQYELLMLAMCAIALLQTNGWSDSFKGLLVVGVALATAAMHGVMVVRGARKWDAFIAEEEARSDMSPEQLAARGRLEGGLARIGFGSVMPSPALYRLLEAIQALAAEEGIADIEEACAQKMSGVSAALGRPIQVRVRDDEGE